MLFSSLYSMLPSAKRSLQDGGYSSKQSAWILIGCFLGGALVIQLVSRILHHHMPTHVVDCEHHHDEDDSLAPKESVEDEGHTHEEHNHHEDHNNVAEQPTNHHHHHTHQAEGSTDHRRYSSIRQPRRPGLAMGVQSRNSAALLSTTSDTDYISSNDDEMTKPQRPSLPARLSRKLSNITNRKSSCDCDAPCYGFTEPCGTDCFKNVQTRGSFRHASSRSLKRGTARSTTRLDEQANETMPLLQDKNRAGGVAKPRRASDGLIEAGGVIPEEIEGDLSNSPTLAEVDRAKTNEDETPHQVDHHHHVPTNAFLSIGLQTSIAIALHKLPEGFITYATNHANPKLGFAVFLALFIHNITEGFALALPLYLAINSRFKAMMWSFFLGGCSQPIGAGFAALWFKMAGTGNLAPGEGVYGCMFAVTAGIMASVALQLFSESLDLTHNRGLCMIFAFVGMGILGISSALTA